MAPKRNKTWIGYALIVAGLVPAGLVAYSVSNWYRARAWSPTDAMVVSVDLKMQSGTGSRGRSSSTDLFAEYEYEWDATTIRADGVSPFNHIEIFSSYQRKLASALKTAKHEQKSVICYVNPNNPNEAFLQRDFRWLTFALFCMFAVLFSGGGALVVRQYAATSKRGLIWPMRP